MPISNFFATKADIAPGLNALLKARPLQFIRCSRGGEIEHSKIPTYASLLNATDMERIPLREGVDDHNIDRLSMIVFLVLDAGVAVSVEQRRIGSTLPDGGAICYYVKIPSDVPCVMLTPGGLQSSPRAFLCGEIQAGYTQAEELRLYRQIVDTLFAGFKQIGGYFYGKEAMSMGATGMPYAHTTREPYRPWTYEDLHQNAQNTTALPDKPEMGRLSLKDSWNWLEDAGYKAPRNADGTPHLYRHRPKYDDPEDGFNFFRELIDEQALDRLTIPRTYIGKCRAYQTIFKRSDLSRSRFAANQFAYCDFSGVDLSGAYLADFFLGCNFEGAILYKADMRWSTFENCTFDGAKMAGTKLLTEQRQEVTLCEQQQAELVWHEDAGPEPPEL